MTHPTIAQQKTYGTDRHLVALPVMSTPKTSNWRAALLLAKTGNLQIPSADFDPAAPRDYGDIRKLQTAVMMKGAKKAGSFYEKAD